ncbi:hypothetical protein QVD17_41620 [Tagetes erecta]|uniref:Uncharacterized protein n=1 Tax=Tagetes erecta TaxID=13708 RepID=A0AAD8JMG4_TARER|nr:hypothetical protein QVD17_41620 [Tagetes erecta]
MIARPPQLDDNNGLDQVMKVKERFSDGGTISRLLINIFGVFDFHSSNWFSSQELAAEKTNYFLALGLQLLCSERVSWSGGCLRIKELRTHHFSGNRLLSCIGVAVSSKARLHGNDSRTRLDVEHVSLPVH